MERKFKVGDRVNNFRYGDGTIIGIKNEGLPNLVEFDEENMELHDGKHKGKDNHCYWFVNDEITLIPKENKKEKPSIKEEEYVTKKEFGKNLENSGYKKTQSKDGKADIYTKGDKKYSVRDYNLSDHNGLTAYYAEGGEKKNTFRIVQKVAVHVHLYITS